MTGPRKTGWFLWGLLIAGTLSASGMEPVSAEIGKTSAWTGEGVPLLITLRSPGPFSGTASFDIPELPGTVVLKTGRPQVGSETVAGETFMTQRHEFILYTAQHGSFTMPAFSVRFEGKQSFVGDPLPVEAQTDALHFISKRPPGSEHLGFVMTTPTMEIKQSWSLETDADIQAGDVVQRTVTRHADGTTAMLFTPLEEDAPDGVRLYMEAPVVQDLSDRGDRKAERIETLKYQFEREGTFELPELSFVWWNPDTEQLERKILDGKSIRVIAAPTAETATEIKSPWIWPLVVLFFVLCFLLLRRPIHALFNRWSARYHHPEAEAARSVLRACRSDDAPSAYAALSVWKRVADYEEQSVLDPELLREWSSLADHLFGLEESSNSWTGKKLGYAFVNARRNQRKRRTEKYHASSLPVLNPF